MLCLSSTGARGTIGLFYCIANCLSKCAKDTHRVVNEKFVTKLANVRRKIVKLPCSTRTSNFGRVMTSSIATFGGLPLVNCPTRAGSGFLSLELDWLEAIKLKSSSSFSNLPLKPIEPYFESSFS